jgi:FkbM family methyltransferase
MINLALNKPALQSSTSKWSWHPAADQDAKRGNDGDTSAHMVFHTDTERQPWWQVDLEDEFLIRKVLIFNRREEAARLRHFTLLKSLDGKNWREMYRKRDSAIFGLSDDRPFEIEFSDNHLARFVRVRLDAFSCLHFSECQIFGERVGPDLRAHIIEEQARAEHQLGTPNHARNGEFIDIDGLSVFVDFDNYHDIIVRALEDGHYEGQERSLAKALLQHSDRVIEVGTAVGVVSMTAALIVGASNVATFDANSDIVSDARANFERNGLNEIKSRVGVLKNRRKLEASEAEVDFYIADAFWASRLDASESDQHILRKVKVPVFCLEDEIQAHAATFLICDIEGGEVELLLDADLSGIKTIVMETHYSVVGEKAVDTMMRKLILEGFSIHLGYSANQIVVLRR